MSEHRVLYIRAYILYSFHFRLCCLRTLWQEVPVSTVNSQHNKTNPKTCRRQREKLLSNNHSKWWRQYAIQTYAEAFEIYFLLTVNYIISLYSMVEHNRITNRMMNSYVICTNLLRSVTIQRNSKRICWECDYWREWKTTVVKTTTAGSNSNFRND